MREIATWLRSATGNLNHLGINRYPCKSCLCYINQQRNWHLFRDYYLALVDRLELSLKKRKANAARLKRKIFLMDSTVIPFCLELFDWAKFRQCKGAIKLHNILDYYSSLPLFIQVWTAMMAILLLKYLKNKAKYPWHLSNLVSFLRINLFVKIELWKWVKYPFKPPEIYCFSNEKQQRGIDFIFATL